LKGGFCPSGDGFGFEVYQLYRSHAGFLVRVRERGREIESTSQPRTIEGTSVKARLWPHAHGTHRARKEKGGWERERETKRRGGADLLSREEADRSSQPRSVTDGHESSGLPLALPANRGISRFKLWMSTSDSTTSEHARTRGGGREGARGRTGERERERSREREAGRLVAPNFRHPARSSEDPWLEERMRGGGGRETERAREREREGGGDGYRAAAE
jgi:hypothetical protein